MHIERNHNVGKAEAMRRIDTWLEELMGREFPAGVTIQDASKSWSGSTMNFSFRAKKSFFGATISGAIQVNDESAIFDAELPGIITTFVSEDQIRDTLNKQFDDLFPA